MRLFAAVAVLASLPFGMAQTQGGNPVQPPPAQNSSTAPRAAIQKSGIRQTPVTGATSSATRSAKSADVAARTPVVTFQGLCSTPPAKGPCKSVITREDLDRFAKLFTANAAGAARDRLAVQYAKVLVYSLLAEQKGFDKNPKIAHEIQAELKIIRMRILASALAQVLVEQAPASSDAEVQQYYEAHQEQYQQAQVLPISVPLSAQTAGGQSLDRAEVISAMQEIRTRALTGEDFGQLQQDVYKKLQIQAAPPAVQPTAIQRTQLRGDQASVFEMKPGEVSTLFDSPSAVSLIKLESKQVMPLESVRTEVEDILRGIRAQNQLAKLTSNVKAEFNLEYLDLPSQPDLFGAGIASVVAQPSPLPAASKAKP